MGLNEGDQEKVPQELTAHDCYERIWVWHRTFGEDTAQGLAPDHMAKYLAILVELPTDSDATFEDRSFLFREVLNGTFEWSYHQEDRHGIKMAAYAFHAVDKQHQGDMTALQRPAASNAVRPLVDTWTSCGAHPSRSDVDWAYLGIMRRGPNRQAKARR